MSDESNDLPSDGYVVDHWITTAQAAKRIGMTTQSVIDACRAGRLRAKKVGDKYRGIWYIDPEAADEYQKGNTGPKPDPE